MLLGTNRRSLITAFFAETKNALKDNRMQYTFQNAIKSETIDTLKELIGLCNETFRFK